MNNEKTFFQKNIIDKINRLLRRRHTIKIIKLKKQSDYFTNQIAYFDRCYDAKIAKLNNEEVVDQEKLEKLTTKKTEKLNKLTLNSNDKRVKNNLRIEKLSNKITKIDDKTISKELNEEMNILTDDSIHIQVRNLSMHFGGLKALDNLSFDVKKGEIFGIIGPNGAGKTTLFNCITQFYDATEGRVYFNNKFDEVVSLSNYNTHDIIELGLARTFQNIELVWELNVLENLLVGAHSKFTSNVFTHLFRLKKNKIEEEVIRNKAFEILTKLDIVQYAYAYPLGLPYGILKKIELARSLMTDPKLIILDEPAAGLNDKETLEFADIVREIRDTFKVTILLVEHDMGLVMNVCDNICAISFGKMLALGTPKEIQNNEDVKRAYLGGDDDAATED